MFLNAPNCSRELLCLQKELKRLQKQQDEACSSLNYLLTERAKALKDPALFMKKLKENDEDCFKMPEPLQLQFDLVLGGDKTTSLPEVALGFVMNVEESLNEDEGKTVDVEMINGIEETTEMNEKDVVKVESTNTKGTRIRDDKGSSSSETNGKNGRTSTKIRKKVRPQGKKNQPKRPSAGCSRWTTEEHDRLCALMRKYPPEEVQAKRWRKIAEELHSRTPLQIQSHVQKMAKRLPDWEENNTNNCSS
ncbi:hypothetical protein SNEBB_009903 [Seison nebaliae]|nr:hypothetical protein SNEBB_009903 [Seison nebaliae]